MLPNVIKTKWYLNKKVQYELVKSMKNREVVFMDRFENWRCSRGYRIGNVSFLNNVFKYIRFLDNDKKNENIYVSCAKFKHIPMFTGNMGERADQCREWFNKYAENEVIGYDMLLDFDAQGDKKRLIKEVKTMIKILDINKVCFRVFPSGSNYQIVIDDSCFKPFELDDLERIKTIVKNIKEMFNLKTLDLKGIGDLRKIRKCEYSLVGLNVCLPFKNMDILDADYDIVFNYGLALTNLTIFNRGLMKFHDHGILNKKNFEEFVKKNELI